MAREFELKYALDGDSFAALRQRYPELVPIRMSTVYFDTPSGALAARKWMLRCRMEDDKPVCTLKTPLPDGSRGEWETECGDIAEAVPVLCKLGCPEELAALAREGLVEVSGARLTRLAGTFRVPGCTLELALDEGVFSGGGREQPFRELEVELKAGSEKALEAFARGLAAEFGLKEEKKSKAQRARELAEIAADPGRGA